MKNIDDCFLRGLLRNVEPSLTKSEQSLLQARDWLSEAEKNLEAEALRSAISCRGMLKMAPLKEWTMLFDRIRAFA
ncbi:MAG: hypothetical protein LUO89_06120 [Methanothrix sp.]|nr:hypothetical protein [Methanothrix sp.]